MSYKCSLLIIIHKTFHFASFENILPIVGFPWLISLATFFSHLGKIVNLTYLLTCNFVDLDTTVFDMSILQALYDLLFLHELVVCEDGQFMFDYPFLLISRNIAIL